MTASAAIFLVLLEIKHFLFDFVFQTSYQLRHKGIYGHPGGLLHSGLHVLGTAVALLIVAAPAGLAAAVLAAEFVVHYHIAWAKEYVGRTAGIKDGAWFWRMIGLDQLLHQLTYVAIAAVLFLR
jgi:hypothetical protein